MSFDEIKSYLESDNFMNPEAAKEFGLIDKVVEKESNSQYIVILST